MSNVLNATLLDGTKPMSISQFVTASTPGNVGVALCGGGSRALTAGMGQLRALDFLTTADGKSLLAQVKAISTVSGGSWLGTTFMYADVKNSNYLNNYVPDQSKLTTKATPGAPIETIVTQLPTNNIGAQITTSFDAFSLVVELIKLHWGDKVPTSMLWQTIVGNHILKPYGLFPCNSQLTPTSTYTYNSALEKQIIAANPSLTNANFALIASTQDSSLVRPAFVICNASMFVTVGGEAGFQYLAPVQSTPFFTGIFSSPAGTDANNKQVGGGGVTSFAFNSQLASVTGANVGVLQDRQWSLADIVGISSAFFAEMLQNTIQGYISNPSQFIADFEASKNNGATLTELNLTTTTAVPQKEGIFAKLRDKVENDLESVKSDAENDFEGLLNDAEIDGFKLIKYLKALTDLVPQYNYWPVKAAKQDPTIKTTQFADAGCLENTGITALLGYSDIDKIISFVNSDTALTYAPANQCLKDANGQPIPNTNIIVDSQIPPLFGYQPYYSANGYLLYSAGVVHTGDNIFKYNQIFNSSDFAPFLQNLAAAAGANLSTNSAMVNMNLKVLDNSWYGIANRGTIQLVLVYTNAVSSWSNLLASDVKSLLSTPDFKSFPHYSTMNTQLTPPQINLLANLTAWTVANKSAAPTFINMFA